jgi:phosphatidylglycerophosphate synthase
VPLYVYALILHGVLGGADVIINHELLARIPSRPNAGPEERMHAARELLFAAIFLSLAWFEWHGQLVWWIAALFLGEVLVSARDVVIEGETRVLPVPERILHLFLFMNLGVLLLLVGAALLGWSDAPTGLARVDYGWASWLLTVLALIAFGWAVRDWLNVLQRRKAGMAG